ncbi:MAG TPA: Stk1 family PASTA domain-containing Ser/Thr kinase [Gaiellaceae bacterium]|nr:Stk1 family PASTA domain-containing Ser/Thr kinase [Gaiellaceae bacterium]
MAVSDTLIGALFDGRYTVVRKLGAGGMANVYLAEDQELGRRVAIKILNERHANDEQFVERFRREAKNAAALSHPNIVSIYDRGEAEGTYYIAMEYIDGRSLKELVVTRGPAPLTVAVEYARQILSALRFAHRHGIVHRDIKPHNVLVDAEGRVKVTDFGIARAGTSQMTEAGSIVGTAQYLSPEQARGTNVDQRSDVYSLGIVLYELLTGTVPFTGDTPVEIAMKHLSAVPEPPSERRPDVPRDLDLIVLRALAKDPEDRYQSAEEMDADLERFLRGSAVSPATEEAATQILRLPDDQPYAATAATMIAPGAATAVTRRGSVPPPPPVYYDLDEPIHRRPIWPWIAALLFVLAAGIGGWILYQQISNKLASNAPVAVGYYVSQPEQLARQNIKNDGFAAVVNHHASRTMASGLVFRQSPQQGHRQPKGSSVTIWVSTGLPRVVVPSVVNSNQTNAVARLTKLGLKVKTREVPSPKPAGTVTAQDPPQGTKVEVGSVVWINIAKGPQPVSLPDVRGQPISQAAATLEALGFKVATTPVDSQEPPNTVVDMSPPPGQSAGKGSIVTLTISKGPTTATVPDVSSQDVGSATSTLVDSGFKPKIAYQDVSDPSLDQTVLDQTPSGGAQAKPGSTVTLTVGRLTQTPTTDTTTTTP